MRYKNGQSLKVEMLAAFYKYTPKTTVALIGLTLSNWGGVLCKNGVLPDTRWVNAQFCDKLGELVAEYRLVPIKEKGTVVLNIIDIDKEAHSWAQKWSCLPYPQALDYFVESVHEWLRTVDLNDEISDKSSNQLIYYYKNWSTDI
jgi:hypothetical protein